MGDESEAAKLPWARGAQRPVWHVNKPNKTGARTRGQNPLVTKYFFCLDVPSVPGKPFIMSFALSSVDLSWDTEYKIQ